jgi:predicted nucleic acid-binding protein
MIVVDTNVISYLFIAGDLTGHAQSAFLKDPKWISPILWRSEFRNVLAVYLHKKIMSLEHALNLIEEAERLMNGREYHVSSSRVLTLALQSGCSAYDCEFVGLATLLDVPLVTSDKQIIKKFPSVAIPLKDFA